MATVMGTPWVGVDFDGTLATYEPGWAAKDIVGEPIQPMVDKVKTLLYENIKVKIFTARISVGSMIAIRRWCAQYLGAVLEITNAKDMDMVEIWDDRAVAVEHNTGKFLSDTAFTKFWPDGR